MEVNQYITFMQMIFGILFGWIYRYYSGHRSRIRYTYVDDIWNVIQVNILK